MSALTTFVDSVVVHQGGVNNLSTNIDTLCQLTTGKTAASAVSTKPLIEVALNANQSMPNNSVQVISWNVANSNTDNMWVVSSPASLTIQTSGWYSILMQVSWASGTLSERNCGIMVNGLTESVNSVAKNDFQNSAASGSIWFQVQAYKHLAAGATVYGYIYQSSGGALNLLSAVPGTYLSARWDAPY